MKTKAPFIKLFSEFNTQKSLDLNEYGTIESMPNDNIRIRNSLVPNIDTIIEYTQEGRLTQISFAGENFSISLSDLSEKLGEYRLAYNFRDDYTVFFFESIPNSTYIKSISCKKYNEIVFDAKRSAFIELSHEGETKEFSSAEELLFNNFTFIMK